MASLGEVILKRFNGVEKYHIKTATMSACRTESGVRLYFTVTTEDTPIQTLPDTVDLFAHPNAELAVDLEQLDAERLVDRKFSVPRGTDADGEWLGRFYYCEHDKLEENVVLIVAQKRERFHVRWTSKTTDVNYYDGSKPRTKVEIDGWFHFADIAKWIRE